MRKVLFLLVLLLAHGSICAAGNTAYNLTGTIALENTPLGLDTNTDSDSSTASYKPTTDLEMHEPALQPDRAGLLSDTKLFLSHQVVFLGFLYIMPESISGWSEEQKNEDHFKKWGHNITHPEWDEDKWYINYIGHPYFGGVYYVRARERGFDAVDSFWYSAFLSLSWEMGLEALAEPVSIQDIFVTPVTGYYVGEYFMSIRQRIRSKPRFERSTLDAWTLFLTDPIGSINSIIRRYTSATTHLEVELLVPQEYTLKSNPSWPEIKESATTPFLYDFVGLKFHLTW